VQPIQLPEVTTLRSGPEWAKSATATGTAAS